MTAPEIEQLILEHIKACAMWTAEETDSMGALEVDGYVPIREIASLM